jgi:hypothetical protein
MPPIASPVKIVACIEGTEVFKQILTHLERKTA